MASVFILGAGAMGSLWAAHLHHAFINTPHQVSFLTTRKTVHTEHTFSLSSPFLDFSKSQTESCNSLTLPLITLAHFPRATRQEPVLVLLCTKSYHALPAFQTLKEKLNEHCHLVLFQNGLGSQHSILNEANEIPIYAAVSTEGVNKKSDGRLTHAGKGITRIGALNKLAGEKARFDTCFNILNHPGLDVESNEDIWQALWQKLVINCAINPFTALLDCPNGQVKDSQLFAEKWPALKTELCTLLKLAGYPLSEMEIEQIVFEVIAKTANNISSMLQDVRAKRPTEVDDINGFAASYLKKQHQLHNINSWLCSELARCSEQ